MRLDKFLSNRTPYSRSEVKALLRQGVVQVDGITIQDASRNIDPEKQVITCQGKTIHGGTFVYYLVNKPLGYICATEDRTHKIVIDLIPPECRVKGLFPAGRLDSDSTGLVLLTDDGALAHKILSPKSHIPKYYLIRLARPFQADYIKQCAEGITLSDGTECLPAEIQLISGKYVLVCLHEGKYHEVRRMFAALGNHVEFLHRVAMGGVILPPTLSTGDYLEVFNKDVENLLKPLQFQEVCEQIVTDFSSYLINVSP